MIIIIILQQTQSKNVNIETISEWKIWMTNLVFLPKWESIDHGLIDTDWFLYIQGNTIYSPEKRFCKPKSCCAGIFVKKEPPFLPCHML